VYGSKKDGNLDDGFVDKTADGVRLKGGDGIGVIDGWILGSAVNRLLFILGRIDELGDSDGLWLGDTDGLRLGDTDGQQLGDTDGLQFGDTDGRRLGDTDGLRLGDTDGWRLGVTDAMLMIGLPLV